MNMRPAAPSTTGSGAGRRCLLVLACIAFLSSPDCRAADKALKSLIGPRDAVLVADPQGKVILSKNADTPLAPASTLKILTSLVAFHYLGNEYRFVTSFYLDGAGNLKVKGSGDPLLTSESFQDIAKALSEGPTPKLTAIGDLVVDPTHFKPAIAVPGKGTSSEPYDAPIGALCANFNTVAFLKTPGGSYVSAEEQTPLLPSVLPRVRASGQKEGRVTLSHSADENTRYAGDLMLYFLQQAGIRVTGKVKIGKVDPNRDRLVYRYVSPFDLDEVVAQLMAYSNNFIANQLLVASGAAAFGPPGTLEKGVKAAQAVSRAILGCEIPLVEGSGLSRKNRLSARQLGKILQAFEPHRKLMRHENGEYYKTGSLRGVRTRAGYLEGNDGGWYRFVVMCNTPGRGTERIMQRVKSVVAAGR